MSLDMAGWSLTIIAANGFTSGFFERCWAIWPAWVSYMSLWLALETNSSVLIEPTVLALTPPTAAPVLSCASLTGWVWPGLPVWAPSEALGLFFWQAASDRAAAA